MLTSSYSRQETDTSKTQTRSKLIYSHCANMLRCSRRCPPTYLLIAGLCPWASSQTQRQQEKLVVLALPLRIKNWWHFCLLHPLVALQKRNTLFRFLNLDFCFVKYLFLQSILGEYAPKHCIITTIYLFIYFCIYLTKSVGCF